MPVEEQDDEGRPAAPPNEGGDGDAAATPTPPPPGERAAARRRRRGWRRVVNRRNAMWTAVVAVAAVAALVIVAIILYRTGQVDRIIAGQIVSTLAKYNIRAEVGHFETKLSPREVELRDLKLYNSVTGAQIGKIDRILARIEIEDLWALNLTRNIELEELTVDRPELWVVYDAQGRSNFADLKMPAPESNKRILFAYSTAQVRVNDAVVHYDDDRYEITGEARNLIAFVRPEDPNAPEASRANLIDLSFKDSTFTYQGRPVENIGLELRARADQRSAEIRELVLRSPVTEARLSGTLDDWRNLRYRMNVNATADLTRASDVLQLETTLRGAGRFEGVVTGEGDKYKVEGEMASDALAADGVRLKGLNVNATASGQGDSYEAQGRAVAELLTAGDYQVSRLQLAGGVTGTGTDFRWIGDLQAAAARSGATSIAGLFLRDAVAEMRDEKLSGSAASFGAASIAAEGARVNNAQGSGVRFKRDPEGATRVTVDSARAGSVVSSGAQISGAQASGVEATVRPDNSADVKIDRVQVAGLNAAGARTASLNIAGVRLAVSAGGRVEGTSGDVNVGAVAFSTGGRGAAQQGRAENVRLARPRFTLEPGGRYRASADLSLGGGVLGEMRLGAARAAVVATNDQIQLNDFAADIFRGSARGSAVIATSARSASSVRASFEGVDAGGLLATVSGRAVPLTGAATGTIDLRFPGTNFKAASGRLDARFEGATGRDESARTPLAGELAVTADRGNFLVERANLRAGATELSASGRFSFSGGSDLAINLNSADAAELQRVAFSTGLLGDIEQSAQTFGVQLGGNLRFNGTFTGDFDSPLVNGRVELASLALKGQNVGALSADIVTNATEMRVENGRLAEPDGGGATFAAVFPRAGENNVSFDATLEGANAGGLIAAFAPKSFADALAGMGAMSGRLSVTGYPGAMQGSADLRVAPGRIGAQPYESIVARATFSGTRVQLETAEMRLAQGRVTAAGALEVKGADRRSRLEVRAEGLRLQGSDVPLGLVTDLAGGRAGLPALSGLADFTAEASGDLLNPLTVRLNLNATGRDVAINGQPAGELTLVGRMTEDQKFVVELTTGLLGRPQVLRATLDLAAEDGITLNAETTLTGADLTPLFAALLNNPDVRVTGRATGSLSLSGQLMDDEGAFTAAGLRGRAEFSELTVQVMDVPLAAEDPLVVLFTPNEVTFDRTRFTGPGTNISFGGTFALAEGGRQNLTVNGELNLRVLSDPRQNFFLGGTANVGVAVRGTAAEPRITGSASVAGGSLALLVTDERLTATEINGSVRFNENQASVETLTGRLGGGRFTVTGGTLLAGFRPTQFRLVARGTNVTVPFPDQFRTTADAELEVSGRPEAQIIQGTVNVRRSEYTEDIDLADLIDRRREASLTEGGGGGDFLGPGALTVDLSITGRDALVVRNNLADIVGSLNVRVRGPVDDPVISGRVTATRGTLSFRNDRFEIERAIIDLPPRRGADPVVNVAAVSEIRGYRVRVGITGPISQPTTSLSSDPALPQADVVSLITTGNLSTGGEGGPSLVQSGIGTATSLLTESLINAPVRKATDKLFGLNRFEFDPVIAGRAGQSPTARLTVGRQINRDLAVTFSTNVTGEPNQVLAVEYRVSDRLSFIAQYQQGPTDTLRTRSNNFNFELRFRKRY